MTYLSTSSRVDSLSFQAGSCRRRPNLALVLFGLFYVVVYLCRGCIFAFVVFDLAFQYLVKRLAGKNVFKMTCFVSGGT